MAPKNTLPGAQVVRGKSSGELVWLPIDLSDSLRWWAEQYFAFGVTALESSQVKQGRELGIFLPFMEFNNGTPCRRYWSSRLSGAFVKALQKEVNEEKGAIAGAISRGRRDPEGKRTIGRSND